MPLEDDDGPLEETVGRITNIYWDESNNGSEYLALEIAAENSGHTFKLWVWSSSWQNDLTSRQDFYEGLLCRFVYVAKYPPHYMPFKYLVPLENSDEWRVFSDTLNK